jgi:hypothetical protein
MEDGLSMFHIRRIFNDILPRNRQALEQIHHLAVQDAYDAKNSYFGVPRFPLTSKTVLSYAYIKKKLCPIRGG